MRKGYGIRVFPVLCVLLLLLPAVCAGGTFDCDACGKSGKPKARRLNNETINGDEGYWEEYVCPNCGARIPGMAKKWVKTGSSKPKATNPPDDSPANPPAQETKVPVVPQNTKKNKSPATAAPTKAQSARPGKSAGNTRTPESRNLERYPFFSAAYPFRRLNMEGNPEAQAPLPGVQVWPEGGGTSPLMRMLGE